MLEYLQDSSLFYILPEDIETAGIFKLRKSENNTMTLFGKSPIKLSVGNNSEVFVNSNEGIIYFHTVIKNVTENIIEVDLPQDYEILQRRESKRVKIGCPVVIKKDDFEENVMLIDISAGGIKIFTKNQIQLNKDYEVILNFDNLDAVFTFLPQRISFEGEEDKGYLISGQIVSKSPKDKIALVQYCYKKIFEQSNRE